MDGFWKVHVHYTLPPIGVVDIILRGWVAEASFPRLAIVEPFPEVIFTRVRYTHNSGSSHLLHVDMTRNIVYGDDNTFSVLNFP